MTKQEIKIDVSSILNSEIGSSQTIPLQADIKKFNDDFNVVDDLKGVIAIERISNKKLLVLFNLKTTLECTCARCLKKFKMPIKLSYNEYFGEQVDNDDFAILKDKTIDIYPSIRQEILLSIPIKPLCRKSCKGIKF